MLSFIFCTFAKTSQQMPNPRPALPSLSPLQTRSCPGENACPAVATTSTRPSCSAPCILTALQSQMSPHSPGSVRHQGQWWPPLATSKSTLVFPFSGSRGGSFPPDSGRGSPLSLQDPNLQFLWCMVPLIVPSFSLDPTPSNYAACLPLPQPSSSSSSLLPQTWCLESAISGHPPHILAGCQGPSPHLLPGSSAAGTVGLSHSL